MKKNPNEDIITAIKIRQLDLAIKATEIAIKGLEKPPQTFAKSMKFIGKELQIVCEVVKLQRIKRELEPKPEPLKGAIIPKLEYETIITATGNEIKVPVSEKLYVKDPIIEMSKKCYGN